MEDGSIRRMNDSQTDAGLNAIFTEVDEELRQKRLHALWLKWRNPLFTAIIVIIAATAIYVYISERQNVQRAETTESLIAHMRAVTSPTAVKSDKDALSKFAKDTDGNIGAIAKLSAAGTYAPGSEGNIEMLSAAASSGGKDVYRDLAKLLLAVNTANHGDLSQADVSGIRSQWHYLADELEAIKALKAGEIDTFRQKLQALSRAEEAPESARLRAKSLLELPNSLLEQMAETGESS